MRTLVLAQGWLVVVTGLSGAPQYRARFDSVATALQTAARTRLGLPDAHVIRLGEQTTPPSSVGGIQRTLAEVASRAGPRDVVAVVLVGHGSAMGGEARFNVAGPDLTAEQLRAALARFPTQEIVVVNAASASGPWMEALAGPRRTIITATRSAVERDETRFPRYFAEALSSDAGDADKDGRISLLEAFTYARQGVDRAYQAARHLKTEHAMLSDTVRAAAIFFDAPAAVTADSALATLLTKRDSLQRVLTGLRGRNDSTAMDALLLEIARTGAAIRARQGARP